MGSDRLQRCNPWAWTYLDKYYYGIDCDRISDQPENHYLRISNVQYPISHSNIQPQKSNNQQPTTEIDFADYLYNSGDYIRAIGEYKRSLFSLPDTQDKIKEYVQLMLGEAYLKTKDYNQALSYFGLRENFNFHYGQARTYFEQGDYTKARDELNTLEYSIFDKERIILTGVSYFRERNFTTGARFLTTNSTADASLVNQLSRYDGKEIKHRNRFVASLFSAVIPGLGQACSGRFGDGLYSLLTVVGCGSIAYYYWGHDNSKIKFSIFTVFTTFFWSGNIYGANIAARDYNEYQIRQYLQRIDNDLKQFDFTPDYSQLKR